MAKYAIFDFIETNEGYYFNRSTVHEPSLILRVHRLENDLYQILATSKTLYCNAQEYFRIPDEPDIALELSKIDTFNHVRELLNIEAKPHFDVITLNSISMEVEYRMIRMKSKPLLLKEDHLSGYIDLKSGSGY